MKRIVLFLATNIAVLLVLSIILKVLGLDKAGYAGAGYGELLVFSAVVGFTGAIISLLMSKPMAKWSTGAQVITQPSNEVEAWLVSTVQRLAQKAGIGMPEVAIYDGEPNAFATGAFKNSSLVAVSTGLLQSMNKEEVEAVLAHEVAHVANGDMVTLTLIQGVVNTFVIFLSRIIGSIVDSGRVQVGARQRSRVLHHRDRAADRAGLPRVDDRGVVLAPARVPRRRRLGAVRGIAVADGQRAAPPGRRRAGPASGGDEGLRHHRPPGLDGALLEPSADRGAHRGASEYALGNRHVQDRVRGRQGHLARRLRRGRKLLTFEKEDEARAALAQRYPILFEMEKYGGGKRTRVIRILEDDDDWPKKK
jgi:hypothetical protein